MACSKSSLLSNKTLTLGYVNRQMDQNARTATLEVYLPNFAGIRYFADIPGIKLICNSRAQIVVYPD